MSPTILTRRRFLKQVGGFAGSSAFATALGMHKWAAAAPLDDYKALVCVFLYGGNDGMGTVVPRSGAAYTSYAAARGPCEGRALGVPSAPAFSAMSARCWLCGRVGRTRPVRSSSYASALFDLMESDRRSRLLVSSTFFRPTGIHLEGQVL